MGKVSPVAAKYIIHATINIEGVVDRPDVIGAIFGQTEGLLGADLELRELQRSGRIGRIEVNIDTRSGKSQGSIIIPSSLDKAETSIIGAALEIIERIGPCNAKIKVSKIEDIRISKRQSVISRAKELLRELTESVLPDSQELSDEVAQSVRVMEIKEYGKERLPAGPTVEESEEIIIVEGRADVLNLLKHGIKNTIGINGTSVPQSVIELSKRKNVTVFVDGDRGGDLIIKELMIVANIDFVTKAPDGKEVEEITQKEIHIALRARTPVEQIKMDTTTPSNRNRSKYDSKKYVKKVNVQNVQPQKFQKRKSISQKEKETFKTMLEDLIGTRGAYVLDEGLNILGKVPITELNTTIKSLSSGIYAIVFDGSADKNLLLIADRANVKYLIGMENKIKTQEGKIQVLTSEDL